MAQVLIRDLPDDVVERLKAKAAAEGHSLEAHLRIVLEKASRLDRDEFLALCGRERRLNHRPAAYGHD